MAPFTANVLPLSYPYYIIPHLLASTQYPMQLRGVGILQADLTRHTIPCMIKKNRK